MSRRLVVLILTVIAATAVAVSAASAATFVPAQTPDNTWNVSGTVFDTALSEDGQTLYVGGKFTKARKNPPGTPGASLAVNNVAAIDVATGEAITSWNPKATGDGAVVQSLAVKNGKVYIGGNFTEIGGEPRRNLAAVDGVTGAVEPFDPQVLKTNGPPSQQGAPVLALLPGDSDIYVGGFFNSVDGANRTNLAAVDLVTGDVNPAWRPKANDKVRDLQFAPDNRASIIAAGKFFSVTGTDGTNERRVNVARFQTADGNLHPWKIPANQEAPTPQQGWELVVTDTTLYGAFGLGPNFAAAYRLNNGSSGDRIWRWDTVGNVQTLALAEDGSRLFIGGHFGTNRLEQNVCSNRPLSGLLSLNPQTGAPLCDWVPQLAPSIDNTNAGWSITPTPGKVWVGGGFTQVSGVNQPNIARFDYGPANFAPRVDLNGSATGGLDATYYDNIDFTGPSVTRVDPTVNFNFGGGSPDPSIGPDDYSARYTGQVEAPVTGQYTFTTESDDGVRLTIDGQTVVENYTDHAPTFNSGTITLQAGERYDVQMDWYERGGGALIRLFWAYPGQGQQIIPASNLVNSGNTGYAANFTVGGGPQLIVDPNTLTVSDTDDANLQSATVTLVDHPDGTSERLSLSTAGTSITASAYGYNTGRITLTGAASVEEYEQVLSTLTYRNNAANPSGSGRTVNIVVNDGTVASNTATSTVTFQ